MMRHFLHRTFVVWLFCLALGAALAAFPAAHAFADSVKTEHVEAELISEVQSVQPGKPLWVALRLKMEEHWHTYWKNPGDSGLATKIKWTLPPGFSAGPIVWPHPIRIEAAGLAGYGYENEILLLTKIDVPATLSPNTAIDIAAKADWLVCQEECIPGGAELKLSLPVKDATPAPSAWTQAFTATRAKLPLESSDWKIRAAVKDDKVILRLTPPSGASLSAATFFPDEELIVEAGEKQAFTPLKQGYALTMTRSKVATELPKRIAGVLVSPDGWRGPNSEPALAVDVPVEPAADLGDLAAVAQTSAAPPAAKPLTASLLLVAVSSAFLGGLILNLMPCVLPVLSIKVLGFVEQAKGSGAKPWQHGVVFTAGVLVSFWILAGALLALRAGGTQLGWGFQLQSPAFVIVLASILFLFGLNLFGVFEVGASLMNIGGNATQKSGWAGSFFSGALATLVATPCTAPFMGSALGVALGQPAAIALLIFTSLALGMSAPYLLLSAVPEFLKFIPKPGVWMETFKQFMGFLLMASVVWLVWVLGNQAGVDAVATLLLAFIVMSVGGWALGRWGGFMSSAVTRRLAQATATALILGGVAFAINGVRGAAPAAEAKASLSSNGGIKWEAFSPERVAELRAAGKPVFIDFTAAWCLSCKVNERIAIDTPEVRAEFEKRGVSMLKADWTSRDETITKTLAEFDRSGVPLYVLYSGGANQPPKVLPEALTPGIVLDALKSVQP